jgi:tRNA A-37 threonylcarbamoyl transferase component Bud32
VRPDLGEWFAVQLDGYRLRHRRLFAPPFALRAVARHRENAAQRERACEHWGPGSSVSRVTLAGPLGPLDLAVKWNHPRGLRRAVAETLRGSRAARAVVGAARVQAVGLRAPEILAVAERRRRGLLEESFLIARFADALPLPALAPALRGDRRRRRAVARALGDAIGRLHAAGLDHRDLKHSNLMAGAGDALILLDLEAVEAPWVVTLRRRVRALGQLGPTPPTCTRGCRAPIACGSCARTWRTRPGWRRAAASWRPASRRGPGAGWPSGRAGRDPTGIGSPWRPGHRGRAEPAPSPRAAPPMRLSGPLYVVGWSAVQPRFDHTEELLMLRIRHLLTLPLLALGVALGAGTAQAVSLSIPAAGCGSCGGLDLYLEVNPDGSNWDVILRYTAPSGYAANPSGLNQAGFKAVKDWTSITDFSVSWDPTAGPLVDVTANWAAPVEAVTAANSLCTNGTTSNKVCTHGFQSLAGGGVLEFRMTLVEGTLLPLEKFHIGGQRANQAGAQPGTIISEDKPIPEPSAAAAFLVGSLVIGAARRRRA